MSKVRFTHILNLELSGDSLSDEDISVIATDGVDAMVRNAMSNGVITGETEAVVDRHSHSIMALREFDPSMIDAAPNALEARHVRAAFDASSSLVAAYARGDIKGDAGVWPAVKLAVDALDASKVREIVRDIKERQGFPDEAESILIDLLGAESLAA